MNRRWVAGVSALIIIVVLAGVLAVALNVGQTGNPQIKQAIVYTYSVVKAYSHDTSAFTEGLVFSTAHSMRAQANMVLQACDVLT
jgi:glutamine cyclotransferase